MQNNKYKQAWGIAYGSGVILTVILAFIYLFSSGFREEVAKLNISLIIASVVASWFICICFVLATAQIYVWVKKRIINKHGDMSKVLEITDKQKNRQVSINITMNSDDLIDIISSLRRPIGTSKYEKQNKGKAKGNKK